MQKRILFFASLLWSAVLLGQQSTDATILGSITDATHAGISNAVVTITNVATSATTHLHTDSHGEYRTPPLRIGEYRVTVEAAGFKSFTEDRVQLAIGDVRKIDAALSPGQVSETVSVSASGAVLNTSDSTSGTVIGNDEIVELPLTSSNGRDYLQLALLSSGTAPAIAGVGISIGGQQGYNVAFLLDGIDNNAQFIRYSYGNQKEAIKPSVDAISQFKVVTNGYSAEYGRSSSGVVSVSIKSGTNKVHGTAYEFIRNDALDATPFFATKTPYTRNNFGASVGLPILRDRLFAFGDFELLRLTQSATSRDTLPTAAERTGCFPGPVYDPATYSGGTRTAFPIVTAATATALCPVGSYQIPQGRIDSIAAKLVQVYPVPATGGALNYNYVASANQAPVKFDFRIDSILSDKQNLFFRWSTQNQHYPATITLPQYNGVDYTNVQPTNDYGHSFAVGYDRIWLSTLISSVRAGWNYLNSVASSANTLNLNAALGFKGADTEIPGGLVASTVTGFTGLGGGGKGNITSTETRQISGDLTWAHGAHNFKFGVQQYWLQTNFVSAQQSEGTLSFTGGYTRQNNTVTASQYGPFADFLLGLPASGNLSNIEVVTDRQPLTHFFVLDDWRINRRLTLNAGLRYELNRPLLDKYNQLANDNLELIGSPLLVLAGANGSSRTSRSTINPDHTQLAPRIGVAYSLPGDKTVIRGAYGIFYSNAQQPGGMQSLQINPPFHLQIALSNSPTATAPALTLQGGFPANSLSLANAANVLTVSDDTQGRWPRAQQWNVNVQRELPGNILFEVGYAGNSLNGAWMQYDANQAPPEAGTTNNNRPFRTLAVTGTPYTITLADILRIGKIGYSHYNSLQARLEKRYASGFSLLASYSYAKTISLGENQSGGVQDLRNIQADRSVSSQDITHHITGSAVYDLPFGHRRKLGSSWNRYANAALGGWSVDPIVSYSTGLPFNLTVNGNPSNSGQGSLDGNNDRPNLNPADSNFNAAVNPATGKPTRNRTQWFNTNAFVANAPYTFGNVGRNTLRAADFVNLDLALHKRFKITGRVSTQLRLEGFNVANHNNLAAPNAAVGTATFGQVTSSASTSARELQAGVKVLF
ncbi:carboxypeptidase-like regulatory domain-containing protein [Granulicella sp. WH15]|uniref:carboxypeptidase-like regulatory domain-containing protein n=1 Tax=Granulicella sp. WH15 TaxID=2602070 RepID=UPI002102B47A|nr:carboxypeptidase-like regulatory domain-containing protein [Granulicella sp. WH15]